MTDVVINSASETSNIKALAVQAVRSIDATRSSVTDIAIDMAAVRPLIAASTQHVADLGPLCIGMASRTEILSNRSDETYQLVRHSQHTIDAIHAGQTLMQALIGTMEHQNDTTQQLAVRNGTLIQQGFDGVSRQITDLQQQIQGLTQVQDLSPIASLRAVAKPAMLGEICDSFARSPFLRRGRRTGSETAYNWPCDCHKRVRTTEVVSIWGHFESSMKTVAITPHYSYCPFHAIARQQIERRLQVTYYGLRRYLKRAMAVSFSMRSGAGGFSIATGISSTNLVQSNRSPAFRIVSDIESMFWVFSRNKELSRPVQTDMQRYFGTAQAMILKALTRGKCSPHDHDEEGNSLLQRAAESVSIPSQD